MEGQEDDDNFPGKIECLDGCLKMFYRPKGKPEGTWVQLSNFSMSPRYHSINKIPGHGEWTIFACQVQGGQEFLVPFTMSDLDSSQKAFSVIDNIKKPFGGQLDTDRIGPGATKAKLHRFLIHSIQKYQRSTTKMAAIVTSSTGFITLELEDQSLEGYSIGPQVVLPTSRADSAVLKLLPKVWIGPKNIENFIHPESIGQSEGKRQEQGEFIKCLQRYHGFNAASPVATLIYVWLMNRKKELTAHGVKLGALNVVGKVNTGKSSLRAIFEAIFPKLPGGMNKIEKTLSVHKLFSKITEERWSLIQDPPANLQTASDIQKMNFFCDNFYENKIEETGASRNHSRDQPAMGLILIWPNEDANLDKANVTATTKSIYLVHERNFEDFTKLDKELREKSECAPGIFHTLLAKPDMDRLKKTADEIMAVYHKILLEKGYTDEILNMTKRLLQQYAILQAGSIQWAENTNFDISIGEIQKYFTEKCIPYILDVIKGKHCGKSGANEQSHLSPEEQLIEKLKNLTEKDFLSHIGIYQELGEPHFGFSLDLANMSKGVESLIKSISTSKGLKTALSRESAELWFKRKVVGCLYGKFRRVQMFVCPVSAIPDALRDTIKERLIGIIPNAEELDMNGNVKAEMDRAFGELYGTEDPEMRSSKQKLMEIMPKLSEEEAEKAYRFAEKLVRKRKNESSEESSSDSSDQNDGEEKSTSEVEGSSAIETEKAESVTIPDGDTQAAKDKETQAATDKETQAATDEDESVHPMASGSQRDARPRQAKMKKQDKSAK